MVFGRFTAMIFLGLGLLVGLTNADIYLHTPPGSNNRGGETSATRTANNRLFNSQNNNRGGYNIPQGGSYTFYSGSVMPIQWTAQHGSGIENVKSDIIIQYMCVNQNSNLLRDGDSGANGQEINRNNLENEINNMNIGMHEPIEYYRECLSRERNKGLFTADQNVVNNQGAQATRQNPNGGASGLECQEERDYYPYWHPSPWKDIVILNDSNIPISRDNHLGSVVGGDLATYNWIIPDELSGQKCVLRIRYNVTSGDFDSLNTFSDRNINSINPLTVENITFRNNPQANIGNGVNLQLNVNTAQYSRTFEDRTHVFFIIQRPNINGKIYNVMVRGRRGNIVQTFPAVEYDFVPNNLTITTDDYLHFQWTGSNRSPAGAGQGQENTDRNNLIQIASRDSNFPLPFDKVDFFSSYEEYYKYATSGGSINPDPNLNNISPYFNGGLLKIEKPKTYHFMSSRNNNLSNRSQKMSLVVIEPDDVESKESTEEDKNNVGLIIGILVTSVIIVIGISSAIYYRTRNDEKKKEIREKVSNILTCNKTRSEKIKRPTARFSLRIPNDAFKSAYEHFSKSKQVEVQQV
jgi:hypothetical protein